VSSPDSKIIEETEKPVHCCLVQFIVVVVVVVVVVVANASR